MSYLSVFIRKGAKLFRNPGLFFRDFLNKRYPVIRNEILCPEDEEAVLIKNDEYLERLIDVRFPVDVVYTWVNDSDPTWLIKYNNYKNGGDKRLGRYATDKARFNNHNELYYSVKSVVKYLPWVRNIFVVTDEQTPSWIHEFPFLKIIKHKDIIPDCYLPTFNSHVIEAHLHNITGLAENFIYFNDDVFVAKPLSVGHFFKSNGIASLFVSQKSISEMLSRGINTPTLSASINVSNIFVRDFNVVVDHPLVHTYVPLKKSYYEKVWMEYEKEITSFLMNKFRTDNDMNLATFFVPWMTYLCGEAITARDICYYFNIRSATAKSYYSALLKSKENNAPPHSFCANDFNTEGSYSKNYKCLLKKSLERYFE